MTRKVSNQTENRVLVEWIKADGKCETIANLSPGMSYESHPTFKGTIRISAYDDRDLKDRDDVNIVLYTPTETVPFLK